MPQADYVIVGAGSAGCALAGRLSEDPTASVLLIEAGGSRGHMSVTIPAAFAQQFHTKRDWDLCTEPEPGCDGRSLFVPRGKGLGGSSSMNAMLYVRGRPLDYDMWEAQGADGWGWADVKPYFLRAEDNSRGASDDHAVGGPLRVEDTRSPRAISKSFLAGAEAAGIPYIPDYNGPEQDGASMVQVTQRAGRRWSSADAYLRPVMKQRSNLEVVCGAQVLGVELDGTHASGVRYRDKRGREHIAGASSEVILAAGAIGSPQLLLLSGIGPAEHLREIGVDVRVDLPAVGENLQDHPYHVCIWDIPGGGSLADAEKPKALLEWALRKTGPLTSSVAEAFAFVRTRPGLPAADVQFHFAPTYFVDHGAATYDGHAATFAPALVTPKSRGRVWLRSADPAAKPRILTNSLTEPEDVASLVAGVKLAREIAATAPMREVLGREIFPGDAIQDDADIEADLRRRVELLYHPVGTCRIGTGDDAVVDPQLRVRGVEGLRVADASVMPLIPGGNTNAPAIMIGERAADLVRGRVAMATADGRGRRRPPRPHRGRVSFAPRVRRRSSRRRSPEPRRRAAGRPMRWASSRRPPPACAARRRRSHAARRRLCRRSRRACRLRARSARATRSPSCPAARRRAGRRQGARVRPRPRRDARPIHRRRRRARSPARGLPGRPAACPATSPPRRPSRPRAARDDPSR